jgi:two-component system, chemotaxis family, sensor kinase CheA
MTLHPLARNQLRKAFPATLPDLPELEAFVGLVSDAYTAIDDERRLTELSIQLASDELVVRNTRLEDQLAELRRLEQAVARRTAELDRRNRALALILDNVDQGLAMIALDGSIGDECSHALVAWLGAPPPGTPLWRYLAPDDPDLEAWIQLGFDSLATDAMPFDVVLGQLPGRIERGGRQLRLEYRPVGDPPTALLLVVTDITAEIAYERVERAQRELIAAIEAAERDRLGFFAFVRETHAMLASYDTAEISADERLRQIHTLKGNAALFGLTSLAAQCHELETQLTTFGVPLDGWAPLLDAWRALYTRLDDLLHVSARRTIVIDRDEYQAVVDALDRPDAPWAVALRRWGKGPTRGPLERFAAQARQLARRLGKAELDVAIDDHGVYLDGDLFAPLWSVLVHVVRNAVDHGVEPADDRLAAGKPARARLRLATVPRGDDLAIDIEDDGRGIDWAAVAARAAERGLPHATPRELTEALFADGVSTAVEVTELSGRGVGMAALRAVCGSLGGAVEISSERGRGTRVRCVVPLRAPARQAQIAALCG